MKKLENVEKKIVTTAKMIKMMATFSMLFMNYLRFKT